MHLVFIHARSVAILSQMVTAVLIAKTEVLNETSMGFGLMIKMVGFSYEQSKRK
ncbi:hypothetical protein D3C79_1062950 [compost metagenome]